MKKNIYAFVLSIIGILNVTAQANDPLIQYNVDFIPHSTKLNPAHQLSSDIFIGIPVLGSLNIETFSNNLTFQDAISRINNTKTVLDFSKISELLTDKSKIGFGLSTELLSGGLKAYNGGYWSFGVDLKTELDMPLSDDFMDFFLYGNVHEKNIDRELDFKTFKPSASAYTSINVGYSKDLNKRLRVGGRFHILSGLAYAGVKENSLKLKTNDRTDQTIYGSIESSGKMNLALAGIDTDEDAKQPVSYSPINLRNIGVGLDVGFDYMFNKKVYVSAAVNNLGLIRWGDNPMQRVIDIPADFKYEGFNFTINGEQSLEDRIDEWVDDNEESLDIDSVDKAFTTFLNPNAIVGAKFRINKKNFVNLQSRMIFGKGSSSLDASLVYQTSVIRFLDILVGGNYKYGKAGISTGFNLNFGKFNFYMLSDNVLGPVDLRSSKGVDIAFGMNVQIHHKRKRSNSSRTRWMDKDISREKTTKEKKKSAKRKKKKLKKKKENKEKKEKKSDKKESKKSDSKKRKKYKKKKTPKNEL